jgi:hypothetical protein
MKTAWSWVWFAAFLAAQCYNFSAKPKTRPQVVGGTKQALGPGMDVMCLDSGRQKRGRVIEPIAGNPTEEGPTASDSV